MKTLQIKPDFRVEVIGENVHLLAENINHELSGTVYRHIIPLLDGNHTIDNILSKLEGQVEAGGVHDALQYLADKGYLSETISDDLIARLQMRSKPPERPPCTTC